MYASVCRHLTGCHVIESQGPVSMPSSLPKCRERVRVTGAKGLGLVSTGIVGGGTCFKCQTLVT